jgi:hypothetical protein
MIHYSISKAELENRIDAHAPAWRTLAAGHTATNLAAKKLVKKASIWSDIKPVYMRLQFNKCVYCERPLAGEVAGKVEQDVEHFRPKSKISAWPKASSGLSYDFSTGAALNAGYYWLAFDIQNYAASCKPCNSTRKSDAFPIAGARGDDSLSLSALNALEKPYLVFPFGAWGEDPSKYIRFDGILAVPVKKSGLAHRRALVTIDFFGLNIREELWEDRFRTIRTVFDSVQVRETTTNPAFRAAAERTIAGAISDASPQALCARNFLQLMENDAQRAWQTYLSAEEFVRTMRNP